MMYPRSLAEEKRYLIELKEHYGYENINMLDYSPKVDITEIEWIQMHLVTPIKNLYYGIEIAIDKEDYETAALITKIINWLKSDENEIVFDLKNTEGLSVFKVKKNS